MAKQNLINRILRNTRKPEGFLGRMILRCMNRGHASLMHWGLSHLPWQSAWSVLDIGCGGGAALKEVLKRCPEGKAYGVDISSESVAFARRKNSASLGTHCFIEQGSVERLPYGKGAFDAVTAFETVYFWEDLPGAFSEIGRVLKHKGYFLICCEASDPANTVWTSRIEGMTIHPAEELERLLTDAGFGSIAVYRRSKEPLCIVAQKQEARQKPQK